MRYNENDIEPNPNPSWWVLIWIAITLAVGLAFSSCSTPKTVTVEKVVDHYINKTDTIRDSIRNDIFINQYIKGDTVFRDRIETKYKYIYRAKTDTVLKRDSVMYVVQKEVEVEKKLNWLQRGMLATYPFLFMFVVIVVLAFAQVIMRKCKK